jgi:hypothetical protein
LGLQCLPELPWGENYQIIDLTYIQELLITRHEHINSSRYRSRQNEQVVLIFDIDCRQLAGLRKHGILPQKPNEVGNQILRDTELGPQDTPQLTQHVCGSEEFMRSQHLT